jgi:hypothetical protein
MQRTFVVTVPPHTRLILASDNLLDQWGTRTERGERITVEWGEEQPEGWYEPVFTVHSDDTLASSSDELRAALELIAGPTLLEGGHGCVTVDRMRSTARAVLHASRLDADKEGEAR